MVWSEGRKNPVTPPGIDPGTVRLVAQRLKHYTTLGPGIYGSRGIYFFQVLKFKPTNTQRYIDVTVLLHSPSTSTSTCFVPH